MKRAVKLAPRKSWFGALLIAVPVAIFTAHSSDAQAQSPTPRAKDGTYDFSAVDTFLEKSLDRIGGGYALVLYQDGKVVYRKAFGKDWTPEKVVPIASASKGISAGVIMSLVDEGKLSLDDRAAKYLPEFKGKQADMTIRQMFSHTHGLPEGPHHHRDTTLTMPEAVAKIAELPPVADPGTVLYYSGTGMQAAGRIAEIVSGQNWVDLFRRKIGDPCQMKSTDYYAAGQTKNPNVAGSVRTNADDYGNYVSMLFNKGMFQGQRVLSEKAVETMFTNQTADLPVRRHPGESYARFDAEFAKTRYGVGWWLEQIDSATGCAMRGTSGGAFGCQPMVDYRLNYAGVFMPNCRITTNVGAGLQVNEASVVYLELKPLLAAALGGQDRVAGQGSP